MLTPFGVRTGAGAPSDALERLLDRPVTAARWGLERIEALLEELDHPERAFASYHVAGTNGKGSTATFAEAVLLACGLRTARYASPHLVDPRERFQVDGRAVEEELLQASAARVGACRAAAEATYFEVATALAFLAFAEAGVSHAVVETGLGGRLDATNVLVPVATAITSIGLDHLALLGPGLADVAREKAGILKRGRPVALGPMGEEPRRVIEARADELGVPVRRLGVEGIVDRVEVDAAGTRFRYRSRARDRALDLSIAAPGAHQAGNAGLALLMLDDEETAWPEEAVRHGLASARLPGRFEIGAASGGRWVLDMAHNPDGVERLLETAVAAELPRPWIAVVGILADKPWRAMLSMLAETLDGLVLTRPGQAPRSRRWDPETVAASLAGSLRCRVETVERLDEALERGNELSGQGTVFVTGSVYTVGAARSWLDFPVTLDATRQ